MLPGGGGGSSELSSLKGTNNHSFWIAAAASPVLSVCLFDEFAHFNDSFIDK
jgi:hypothetical protein